MGYTKEARKLIYDFAFEELDIEEIYGQAWDFNINSCISMEKSGFKLVSSEKKLFPY
ncbi:GNAT family N-acetyltransferase (plasmid) [Pseudalkalibacillus hwajinpoensis]|uniref:GNAT family N-acetyltransferase n=1 Tax=Guptibacillus hwajinpoensis TaxID=208199 RepID=UPI00325C1F3E